MRYFLQPTVDAADVSALVGGTSYLRGLTYAHRQATGDAVWDGGSLQLSGKVHGTSNEPYRTTVQFQELNGSIRPKAGKCSCPMRINCKHVAALMLSSTPGSATQTGKPKDTAPRGPAPWEQQLDTLMKPKPDPGSGYYAPDYGHPEPSPAQLGLQFELREDQRPYVNSRWSAPAVPGKLETKPRIRLAVRPVRKGTSGKWVRSGATWADLRYGSCGHTYSYNQQQWLSTFSAVHNAGSPYPQQDTWIVLDESANPLLWELLSKAPAAGVELLPAKPNAAVALHDPVTVSLDVRSEPAGLRLLPHARVDGQQLNPQAMGIIGSPAHGIFWWNANADGQASLQARNIGLAPTTGTVGDTLTSLINGRVALEVPESGREAFIQSYYPRLSQDTPVNSSDGSVVFPELVPPELVLTMAHVPASSGPGILQLHWHWEYTVHGVTGHRPLVDDRQGYRDNAFETDLILNVKDQLLPFAPSVRDPFPHPQSGYVGSNEPVVLTGVEAAEFTGEAPDRLSALDNVRVEVEGDPPDYTELLEAPKINISTEAGADNDWFDLGVTVTMGENKVPFDQLFRALAAGEEHFMLDNGNYFELDKPEFEQLRRLIEEAKSLQDGEEGLRISRYQAALWNELEELAATSQQAEAWRSSVSGLLKLSEVPDEPIPEGINASLRPYQQEGFNWLAFLYAHGLGGVLADDMGLGKTLQTLALICHANSQLPFLVVAPTSVVSNWAAEIQRFTPGLRAIAVTDTLSRSGADPAQIAAETDVVIVSYTLFRLDYEAYAGQQWAGLILDEAQFVKNRATKANQNARRFPTPFKLAITGTPMENNLMELWSMFAITAPGLFPSAKHFADYYQKPVEKESDKERLAQLRRRIRPLLMRRTKEAVATDLPPKQEQVLELELSPRHRVIYQRHLQRERQKVLGLLGDMNRNRFAIFKSLTTLRMLSLDASLVDARYTTVPSTKLDALLEQLEDIRAEGHRTLVFSQFTSFLHKAADRLDAAGIDYAYLDGKTRRRGDVIEAFKSGKATVFLISLKAGGFGINLTEADYCFLLDPWWNPATENQAVDRTHRIGQTKNVMVYRLVAKDTIEEKVMALKEKKAQLFASVMDDDAVFSSALSAADVRGLFAD